MAVRPVVNWNGRWHPLAERFAMLGEDELRTMAASIAEHGQFVPCRLDADGLGLDGRNRVAACALAGVEPKWERYDGDPIGLIVGVNAERRSWTTGQRAMATALGLVESGQRQGGRFKRGSVPVDNGESAVNDFGRRVREARVVLDHAPKLVDGVIAGEPTLDAAYKQALANRDKRARIAALGNELGPLVDNDVITLEEAERRAQEAKRVAALSPDLSERVTTGQLDIDEAELIARERRERILADVERIRGALRTLIRMADAPIADGLTAEMGDEEITVLKVILTALEGGSYGFLV